MSVKDSIILSWNCRGFNSSVTRDVTKILCRSIKAKVLCLQETKYSRWNSFLEGQVWDIDTHSWLYQNSTGLSGGLACSWNNSLFKCVSFAQSKHWIWIQFQCLFSQELFNIVNVYSPLRLSDKRILWMELTNVCTCSNLEPVCIVGDFNCIRADFEKKNCEYSRRDSKGFESFYKR